MNEFTEHSMILRNTTPEALLLIVEPWYATYDLQSNKEVEVIVKSKGQLELEITKDSCVIIYTDEHYAIRERA